MNRSRSPEKIKLLPEIVDQLNTFARSTPIPLRMLDAKGKTVWLSDSCKERDFFCHVYRGPGDDGRLCRMARKKAVRESLRWGEITTTACCHSLMQIAAPVLNKGKLAGSLVASPFSLVDVSQCKLEDGPYFRNHPHDRVKFEKALPFITTVKEGDARLAAQKLFLLADRLSFPNLASLVEVRKIQDLQGKIADQIYSLKTQQEAFDFNSLVKLSIEEEKQIITKIRLGDREGATEILYRILAILLSQYIENFELLKISVLEFLIIITRAAVGAGVGIEEVLGIRYRFFTESARIRNQETLCIWVVQLLGNIMDKVYKRHAVNPQRLEKAMNFIEANYGARLTVAEIAREVCLSPSRLSHIFKRECGMTLGDCISQVRIDKAKILLSNKNLSISQVALAVGFPDQSYFTKKFRKLEKTTPKVFKNSL